MTRSSVRPTTFGAVSTGASGARSALVGTGAVLGVVLAATATLVALRGPAAGACASATSLKLVAAPAIAPTVQEIVRRDVDATCASVRVVPQNSADTEAELAADSGEAPALWIPDSSLWPKRARQDAATQGGARLRIEEHDPLVISPLVAVTQRTTAAQLGTPDAPLGWQDLVTGPVPTTIGDPLQTTEGLATLLVVRRLLGNPDGSPKPELVAALLKVGRAAVPAVQAAYDKLGTSADPLAFTATEQSVVAYNRVAGRSPVVALYPKEGTVALDYPVVRVSVPNEPSALSSSAEAVEAALRTPEALRTMQAAGFRSALGDLDGAVTESAGINPTRPAAVALPPIEQATEVLRTWSAVTLESRALVLIDVSGSMDADAGGGMTRIELARDAALTALGLFPDSTQVGLWAFSIQQAPPNDWAELVPMGPLGSPGRKEAMQQAFASLPSRTNGGTGLNDSVLAAYRTQRAGYDAGRVNSVVVLTDGRNEDPNGVNDATLLRTLRAETDPAHPVPIILVGMGPDVDFNALQQIAAATGGKAYLAKNPADIQGVFLDALIQRRCRPSC
jgi:Ca-activated chloride channel homolog